MLYSLSGSSITNSSSSAPPCASFCGETVAAVVAVVVVLGGGGGKIPPEMKSLINLGVAVSNPARFSVFRSLGSAIVKQFDVIPTTMSLASIPVAARYCSRAACGWILPANVSLSV